MIILLNMNLIINDNNFSINNIILKQSKKSTKIIYKFKELNIIGIGIILNNYEYKYKDNYLHIKLKDKVQLKNIKEINNYLKDNILNYEEFIKENVIKIKKNLKNKIINNSITININSLKAIDNKNKVQIFII